MPLAQILQSRKTIAANNYTNDEIKKRQDLAAQLADKMLIANVKAFNSDFDGTILWGHTFYDEEIRKLFSGNDFIGSPQQAQALFADPLLFVEMLKAFKERNILFGIASKQTYEKVVSLIEKAFGKDFIKESISAGVHGGGEAQEEGRTIQKKHNGGKKENYNENFITEFEQGSAPALSKHWRYVYTDDAEGRSVEENLPNYYDKLVSFGGEGQLPAINGSSYQNQERPNPDLHGLNMDNVGGLVLQLQAFIAESKEDQRKYYSNPATDPRDQDCYKEILSKIGSVELVQSKHFLANEFAKKVRDDKSALDFLRNYAFKRYDTGKFESSRRIFVMTYDIRHALADIGLESPSKIADELNKPQPNQRLLNLLFAQLHEISGVRIQRNAPEVALAASVGAAAAAIVEASPRAAQSVMPAAEQKYSTNKKELEQLLKNLPQTLQLQQLDNVNALTNPAFAEEQRANFTKRLLEDLEKYNPQQGRIFKTKDDNAVLEYTKNAIRLVKIFAQEETRLDFNQAAEILLKKLTLLAIKNRDLLTNDILMRQLEELKPVIAAASQQSLDNGKQLRNFIADKLSDVTAALSKSVALMNNASNLGQRVSTYIKGLEATASIVQRGPAAAAAKPSRAETFAETDFGEPQYDYAPPRPPKPAALQENILLGNIADFAISELFFTENGKILRDNISELAKISRDKTADFITKLDVLKSHLKIAIFPQNFDGSFSLAATEKLRASLFFFSGGIEKELNAIGIYNHKELFEALNSNLTNNANLDLIALEKELILIDALALNAIRKLEGSAFAIQSEYEPFSIQNIKTSQQGHPDDSLKFIADLLKDNPVIANAVGNKANIQGNIFVKDASLNYLYPEAIALTYNHLSEEEREKYSDIIDFFQQQQPRLQSPLLRDLLNENEIITDLVSEKVRELASLLENMEKDNNDEDEKANLLLESSAKTLLEILQNDGANWKNNLTLLISGKLEAIEQLGVRTAEDLLKALNEPNENADLVVILTETLIDKLSPPEQEVPLEFENYLHARADLQPSPDQVITAAAGDSSYNARGKEDVFQLLERPNSLGLDDKIKSIFIRNDNGYFKNPTMVSFIWSLTNKEFNQPSELADAINQDDHDIAAIYIHSIIDKLSELRIKTQTGPAAAATIDFTTSYADDLLAATKPAAALEERRFTPQPPQTPAPTERRTGRKLPTLPSSASKKETPAATPMPAEKPVAAERRTGRRLPTPPQRGDKKPSGEAAKATAFTLQDRQQGTTNSQA